MKFNRRIWLLALLPLAGLGWAMKSAASWRPRPFIVQPGASYPMFSLDGRLLLVDTINNVNGFHVWDVATARPLWKKGNRDKWLLISSKSQLLMVAHGKSQLPDELQTLQGVTLELHNARDGRLLRSLQSAPSEDSVFLSSTFSPDGSEFRIATTASLQRWSVADGQLKSVHKWVPRGARSNLSSAEFVPDKNQLLTFDGSIALRDARTGKILRRFPKSLTAYRSAASGNFLQVTPDSFSFYFAADDTNTSPVIRLSDGKELWRSADWPTFSPDGKLAYIPSPTGLDVLDAHTGRKLNHLPGPKEYGFDPSPDGNWLVEARDDKVFRWRAR